MWILSKWKLQRNTTSELAQVNAVIKKKNKFWIEKYIKFVKKS